MAIAGGLITIDEFDLFNRHIHYKVGWSIDFWG